ncbi:MAG: transglutaminase-like cysteine peptidase [Proteobacteria bacterium]|uniref:transglutaminase-like cysteine peptidase n=1 Tax=Aquabacterium sp. TaxID=1872578 RepID=UPI0035C713BA|nr:transglutaminase-like cysteine peptidase [Pseudomonadota bacterium]
MSAPSPSNARACEGRVAARARRLPEAGGAVLRRALLWLGAWLVLALAGGLSQAWDSPRVVAQAQKLSPATLVRAQALVQLIGEAASQEEESRLKSINAFFNRQILYRDDREIWGVVDYWASPLETLNRGQADCEDFAVGKYFSLLAAGVPGVKMRLVYVRAQIGAVIQAHMVLAYYPEPGAEPLILDNLLTDIRPASRRPDLIPVFSFNAEGLWQGVAGAHAGDPSARLSRWRDVLAKAKAEGWW